MSLERPRPGAVIRYAYLWAGEHAQGRDEGSKDRPALVLAVSVRSATDVVEVLVLAVTHTPPADAASAVVLPADVKRLIGLDDAPSWIVTTEANAFAWPGPDIRPIPGRKPPSVIYGHVPDGLLRQIARSYLANRERQRKTVVPRSE